MTDATWLVLSQEGCGRRSERSSSIIPEAFPGQDDRRFWQRVDARNRGSAALLDRWPRRVLAMEAYVAERPPMTRHGARCHRAGVSRRHDGAQPLCRPTTEGLNDYLSPTTSVVGGDVLDRAARRAPTFISTPGLSYGNAPDLAIGFLQIVAGYIAGGSSSPASLPATSRGNPSRPTRCSDALRSRRRFASIVFMVTRALADSVPFSRPPFRSR